MNTEKKKANKNLCWCRCCPARRCHIDMEELLKTNDTGNQKSSYLENIFFPKTADVCYANCKKPGYSLTKFILTNSYYTFDLTHFYFYDCPEQWGAIIDIITSVLTLDFYIQIIIWCTNPLVRDVLPKHPDYCHPVSVCVCVTAHVYCSVTPIVLTMSPHYESLSRCLAAAKMIITNGTHGWGKALNRHHFSIIWGAGVSICSKDPATRANSCPGAAPCPSTDLFIQCLVPGLISVWTGRRKRKTVCGWRDICVWGVSKRNFLSF